MRLRLVVGLVVQGEMYREEEKKLEKGEGEEDGLTPPGDLDDVERKGGLWRLKRKSKIQNNSRRYT